MSHFEIIVSPDTERSNRIPPGQRLTKRFPVLQHGAVPKVNSKDWTFTISGLVEEERTLTFEEFLVLPRVKVFSDIHCVTTWSRLDNLWEGVSTAVIKDLVTILQAAKYVIVHAVDDWSTNLALEDFFQHDVLFAIKHDNKPLTHEHGYPVRLVVPRLYFWKSAKWVTGVEFMAEDKRGFWELHGYHNHGDPWKEERYSER